MDGSRVLVTCGASRFTLLTMPVEDYPALPAMPTEVGVVRGDHFTEAVAQVTVAASRDDTLPLLTGVRMEIEGDTITLLATDRYRLALRTLTWTPASPSGSEIALVRARTLSDAAKSLGTSEQVTVGAVHRCRGRHHRVRGRWPAHHVVAGRRRLPAGPPAVPRPRPRSTRWCPPAP